MLFQPIIDCTTVSTCGCACQKIIDGLKYYQTKTENETDFLATFAADIKINCLKPTAGRWPARVSANGYSDTLTSSFDDPGLDAAFLAFVEVMTKQYLRYTTSEIQICMRNLNTIAGLGRQKKVAGELNKCLTYGVSIRGCVVNQHTEICRSHFYA